MKPTSNKKKNSNEEESLCNRCELGSVPSRNVTSSVTQPRQEYQNRPAPVEPTSKIFYIFNFF
jgi:hypothetical protein